MRKKRKVGFATKLLSNHFYINEIPVEGKHTSKFNFRIGFYDQYVAQIIRTGNCITLLSNNMILTEESFWNTNYFEDLTKYVFWTFNNSFLFKISDKIESLKLPILEHCLKLLEENFVPYGRELNDNSDEELQFCYLKNRNLKRDPKFAQMYFLDEQNRTSILKSIEKRITEFPKPVSQPEIIEEHVLNKDETKTTSDTTIFLEVLSPINGTSEETLQFIIETLDEADFGFKLFSRIPRLENGKNPYGLNGCIAAMIEFFYQHNYFKKDYNLEEIFKAYLRYSGNTIGKLKTFISVFRHDNSFIKHSEKLRKLKISKLL